MFKHVFVCVSVKVTGSVKRNLDASTSLVLSRIFYWNCLELFHSPSVFWRERTFNNNNIIPFFFYKHSFFVWGWACLKKEPSLGSSVLNSVLSVDKSNFFIISKKFKRLLIFFINILNNLSIHILIKYWKKISPELKKSKNVFGLFSR